MIAIVSDGAKAAILNAGGETIVLPGGKQVTGQWHEPTVETDDFEGTQPQVVLTYVDGKYLYLSAQITRLATAQCYTIDEITPDGPMAFTHFRLKEAE